MTTNRKPSRPRRTKRVGDNVVLQWKCGFDYYVLHESQEQIAKRHGLSRPTAARYIQSYRELFTLTPDFAGSPDLTAHLAERLRHVYGLRQVVVAPLWTDDYELTMRLLGRAAALSVQHLLELESQRLQRRIRVGVAGGETLLSLSLALQPSVVPIDLYPVVVGPHPDTQLSAGCITGIIAHQLSGGTTSNVGTFPLLSVQRLHTNGPTGARRHQSSLSAPILEARLDLDALEHARNVDIAIVGIGTPQPGTTFSRLITSFAPQMIGHWSQRFTPERLLQVGLHAEIASQILPPRLVTGGEGVSRLPEEARELQTLYNDNVAGVRLSDLVRLANQQDRIVVAVAGGRKVKLEAIYHSLRCVDEKGAAFRPYNMLITDALTAEELLRMASHD